MELTTAHLWLAAILGDLLLVAAVITLFRKWLSSRILTELKDVVKPVERKVDGLINTAKELGEVQSAHTNQLEALGGQVSAITYQVRPNRGSSLRDTADRTEKTVNELDGKLDSALTDIAVLKSKVG